MLSQVHNIKILFWIRTYKNRKTKNNTWAITNNKTPYTFLQPTGYIFTSVPGFHLKTFSMWTMEQTVFKSLSTLLVQAPQGSPSPVVPRGVHESWSAESISGSQKQSSCHFCTPQTSYSWTSRLHNRASLPLTYSLWIFVSFRQKYSPGQDKYPETITDVMPSHQG